MNVSILTLLITAILTLGLRIPLRKEEFMDWYKDNPPPPPKIKMYFDMIR